ncbi:sulfatase-like hydrolase/transferase [Mucilaginibacter sp. UYCu711]|uniref:sulfatase-like hydrolase/transferase n=1 Tax=Mucilaginibacter sp. UYCu711 TaxID=3156339 RepID=UPI003D1C2C1F
MSTIFSILINGFLIYSVVLLSFYLLLAFLSIDKVGIYLKRNAFTDYRLLASSSYMPSVSILAPAYNEGKTIIENVRSLLSLYYSNLEIIVINDGSEDDSMQQLIEAYNLEKVAFHVSYHIPTKEVKDVYKSTNPVYKNLFVIDKINGGKADALNAGINISENDYLISIDADCILEQDAVLKMIKPFLEETTKKVIASGGVIRIANSCIVEDGRLVKVNLPENYFARMQSLEYIRSFLLGRMAWTSLNGLLLVSGAFGAFDKKIAIACGGYNINTVGEDMELVVRMRRYMEEKRVPHEVTYIPDPLCWTEVPASAKILQRQRNRWIRGTIETLKIHKIIFMNPFYGVLGMLSYPFWFFFEMLAPLVEFFGFVIFIIFALTGRVSWDIFLYLFLFVTSFGYMYSAFAVFMEVRTYNLYNRRSDVMKLLIAAFTEPFYFRPICIWAEIRGYVDLLRGKNKWGTMTREGFSKASVNTGVAPAGFRSPFINLFNKGFVFLVAAFKYFLSHSLLLLPFILLIRAFEIIYNNIRHGVPETLGNIVLLSVIKDLYFFIQTCMWLFPVFALIYLINRRAAHLFFLLTATLLLFLQVVLVQYFSIALVPLGADLWGYTIDDISQTVGAAGGISFYLIISLTLLMLLFILSFAYLPKRIKVNNGVAAFFCFLFIVLKFANISDVGDKWKIEGEFNNNISVNKSAYFFQQTFRHFSPEKLPVNHFQPGITSSRFNYVDKQNYPFLHTIDSTADVLSPYFTKSARPPNIVIIVIEGLGRAFTNDGAYLGNFTPFINSLAGKSLYWKNFLSEGGRTFAVLPSILSSLPFAESGFTELGDKMPEHLSVVNLLSNNGYSTSFYAGFDSKFDNIDIFLKKNNIGKMYDEKTFPSGYSKLPASSSGFSWGYGDKELFRRYLEVSQKVDQPYLSIILTVSTHSPFLINQQAYYSQRFEERMSQLGFTEERMKMQRHYKYQYASILFMDDAVKGFIQQYQARPEFKNTVFLITGDHRMPEIPMSTKIDRYHVPLIIYSPLLKRTAIFSSVSTHFDIAPSLTMWLKKSYKLKMPSLVNWMGGGLDTARQFRNIHAYPLAQTKNLLIDFVMGKYLLNGNQLFRIENDMGLTPISNEDKTRELKSAFNRFRADNQSFFKTLRLAPDSLLRNYTLQGAKR